MDLIMSRNRLSRGNLSWTVKRVNSGMWPVITCKSIRLSVLLVVCQLMCAGLDSVQAVKYPIVLVPGIAGSQLDAIHDQPQHYPWYCPTLKSWSTVWVELSNFIPGETRCFASDISLRFNVSDSSYSSPPGVRTRVRGFGDTASIEWLDPHEYAHVLTAYFHDLVQYLVGLGYVRGKSVFAAPYDWRKSPWHMTDYFGNLTKLVQSASEQNGNSPVIFISHSMGGPVLQAFFNAMNDTWKSQYVRAFFPVEGPWLGAPKVLLAIVSGDDFGTPAPVGELVAMERTLESVLYLRPNEKLWPAEYANILTIKSSNKTYSVHDVPELLDDLNIEYGTQRLDYVDSKVATLRSPDVETYCIHGYNVGTPYHYIYEKLNSSKPLKIELGDGDGTVPLQSLAYCAEWEKEQSQTVRVQTFEGIQHVNSIKSPVVFEYISKILSSL